MNKKSLEPSNRRNFIPSLLGVFTNPFFIARRNLYRGVTAHSDSLSGNLLDVGCGTKPYRHLFSVDNYIGMEIDTPIARHQAIADVFYEGGEFPFPDESFDSVVCSQVLEHVFNPSQFLSEIRRVLVPDGTLLLTVPFVWDEHEQPWDYGRYSSFGLVHLLNQSGFSVLAQEKLTNDASLHFQLLNCYLYKLIVHRSKYLRYFVTLFVMGPLTIAGTILGSALPRNPDLYLDQIVVAKR